MRLNNSIVVALFCLGVVVLLCSSTGRLWQPKASKARTKTSLKPPEPSRSLRSVIVPAAVLLTLLGCLVLSETLFGILLWGESRPGLLLPVWKVWMMMDKTRHGSTPIILADDLFRKLSCDTVVISVPLLGTQVLTRDALLIRNVLKEFENFVLLPDIVSFITKIFPGELLIQEAGSARHAQQRHAMKSMLLDKQFLDKNMFPLAKDLAEVFLQWKKAGENKIDLLQFLYYIGYRRSARLFVADNEMVEEEISFKSMPQWMAFHKAYGNLVITHLFPKYGLRGLIPFFANDDIKTVLDQYANIKRRTEAYLNGPSPGIAVSTAMTEAGFDPSIVSDQMVDTMAAAANEIICIVCALKHISDDPSILAKIRQEADEVFGNPSVDDCKTWNLSMSVYNKLVYCQAVIKETLRLHPPVAAIGRQATVDRFGFRKGDNIMLMTTSLHLDEKLWGPDAKQFKPERWESQNPEFFKSSPDSPVANASEGRKAEEEKGDSANLMELGPRTPRVSGNGTGGGQLLVRRYYPFGAGNKACLGQQAATIAMVSTVSLMLLFFDIRVEPVQFQVKGQLVVAGETTDITVKLRMR